MEGMLRSAPPPSLKAERARQLKIWDVVRDRSNAKRNELLQQMKWRGEQPTPLSHGDRVVIDECYHALSQSPDSVVPYRLMISIYWQHGYHQTALGMLLVAEEHFSSVRNRPFRAMRRLLYRKHTIRSVADPKFTDDQEQKSGEELLVVGQRQLPHYMRTRYQEAAVEASARTPSLDVFNEAPAFSDHQSKPLRYTKAHSHGDESKFNPEELSAKVVTAQTFAKAASIYSEVQRRLNMDRAEQRKPKKQTRPLNPAWEPGFMSEVITGVRDGELHPPAASPNFGFHKAGHGKKPIRAIRPPKSPHAPVKPVNAPQLQHLKAPGSFMKVTSNTAESSNSDLLLPVKKPLPEKILTPRNVGFAPDTKEEPRPSNETIRLLQLQNYFDAQIGIVERFNRDYHDQVERRKQESDAALLRKQRLEDLLQKFEPEERTRQRKAAALQKLLNSDEVEVPEAIQAPVQESMSIGQMMLAKKKLLLEKRKRRQLDIYESDESDSDNESRESSSRTSLYGGVVVGGLDGSEDDSDSDQGDNSKMSVISRGVHEAKKKNAKKKTVNLVLGWSAERAQELQQSWKQDMAEAEEAKERKENFDRHTSAKPNDLGGGVVVGEQKSNDNEAKSKQNPSGASQSLVDEKTETDTLDQISTQTHENPEGGSQKETTDKQSDEEDGYGDDGFE